MGFLAILEGLKRTAARAQKELAELSAAAAGAVEALDEGKADRVPLTAITIPATGWKTAGDGSYTVSLTAAGITAADYVNVIIDPHETAADENLFIGTESGAGTLTLKARAAPAAAMKAYYYSTKEDILVAVGSVVLPGKTYTLPPATDKTLGGIMAGEGLNVDENGVASVDKMKPATTTTLGGVIAGSGLSVGTDGTLTVTSVNGFTVKAQTTDPGAGSTLATGTILLVYA